jgi:NAD-dependent deacetylase
MCVGDVGAIEPVASFPFIAKRVGALVLAVNADNSIYALMADHVIAEPLSLAMPELVRLIVGEIGELDAAEFPIDP